MGSHPGGQQLEQNCEQVNVLLIGCKFLHYFTGEDGCQLGNAVLDVLVHLVLVVECVV